MMVTRLSCPMKPSNRRDQWHAKWPKPQSTQRGSVWPLGFSFNPLVCSIMGHFSACYWEADMNDQAASVENRNIHASGEAPRIDENKSQIPSALARPAEEKSMAVA